MSHTTSAAPTPGTRPALSAADILVFVCELFTFGTFAFWGFAAWPFPWNIVFGIATPVLAMLLWALWLANALIGWLRWGFDAWSRGGYWRPRKPRAEEPPPVPNAAE